MASPVLEPEERTTRAVITSPDGFTDSTVRTVTENAKVLGFEPGAGFEKD